MPDELDVLESLKCLTGKVEDHLLSDEGKIGFGDLLKLLQKRELGEDASRRRTVRAGWTTRRAKDGPRPVA